MSPSNRPTSTAAGRGWRALAAAGIVFALIFVVLTNVRPFSRWTALGTNYYFAAAITSPADGAAQVSCRFFGGVRPTPSGRARLVKSETPRVVLLKVPAEELRAVLFETFVQGDTIEIRDPQIVDGDRQVIHRFSTTDAKETVPGSLKITPAGVLQLKLGWGASITFAPPAPITLSGTLWPGWRVALAEFFSAGILFGVLCALLARRFPGAPARAWSAIATWAAARPAMAVFLAALAAVLVSCHPIVFLGRSFVSPNNGAQALYDDFPSLPGSTDVEVEDSAGSDLGAMMWAFLPYSVMQHEALAAGEWPLRNHHANCGLGLQGQGISMFGDPLHFIPVAANGAAWAWDVKFLLAKLLFAWGAGLLALAAVRRVGIAALLAASAPFIGFFAFRFNHAAFFTMCYSPWILLPWLRVPECGTLRSSLKWMLLLVLASLAELNSGALKEAAILLGTLNCAGLLSLLLRPQPWRERIAAVSAMAWANVLFVLVAAPFWMTFVDLLGSARTVYDDPKVFQIQPGLLAGLFDDLFYRQLQPREQHFAPSANFLLLLGVLWSLVRWRSLSKDPAWLACVLVAVPDLAVAFGVVPPSWIAATPFIGKIWHVDNCFSLPVILLMFVVAAFGLRECFGRHREPGWRADWIAFAVMLGGLYALYFGFTHAAHRGGLSLLAVGDTVPKSPFFMGYSAALAVAVLLLPWLWRRASSARLGTAGWLVMLVALFGIHFRHSMYVSTKFDAYMMNPQPRQDIHALSPAVEAIRHRMDASGEPARVLGLYGNLTPDFSAVYGLETPFGCDAVTNPWQWELADAAGFLRLWHWRIVVTKSHFPAVLPVLDLLNVRYFVTMPDEDHRPIPGLSTLGERDMVVHESRTTWPRAFFTDRIARYNRPADFVKLVNMSEAKPLAAIQSGGPPPPALDGVSEDIATRTVIPATRYKLTPNTTEFQVSAPGSGVVVLGDAFESRNYRVSLDGRPVEYFRVNHAFLGVRLHDAGVHTLRFDYWPRVFTLALWISAAGIAGILATIALALSRKSGPTTPDTVPCGNGSGISVPVPELKALGVLARTSEPGHLPGA